MDLQEGRRWEGFLMRWHWWGQWEQLGSEGGEQGRRNERREHEEAETRNGVAERLMGWGGMEGKVGHLGECTVVVVMLEGCGVMMMEEVLGLYDRIEKEWLFMEIRECGVVHVSWKLGWPQLGMDENGNGGFDWKGGQWFVFVFVVGLG